MSTSYTRETYTPDVLRKEGLTKLRPDAVELIGEAVRLDWTAHVQTGHGVSLEAPPPNDSQSDNPQFIKFSTTERAGAKNMTSILRKVHRYGDPDLSLTKRDGDAKKARKEREREEAKAFAAAEKKAARERAKQKKESTPVMAEALNDAVEKAERYIVSQAPMMAKTSSTQAYPSDSTIERHWSDGTVDYACAVEGCTFTSDNRYGPSRGHRKTHTQSGEVTKLEGQWRKGKQIEFVDAPPEPKKKEKPVEDTLANRFKTVIESGIDWANLDVATETLAHAADLWAVDQGPIETDPVLDQIRALLDDGESARQRDEIAALHEKVAALEVKVAEAQKDAQKQRDTMAAFRALIAEEAS